MNHENLGNRAKALLDAEHRRLLATSAHSQEVDAVELALIEVSTLRSHLRDYKAAFMGYTPLEVFIRERHRQGRLPDTTCGDHAGKVAMGYIEELEAERDELRDRLRALNQQFDHVAEKRCEVTGERDELRAKLAAAGAQEPVAWRYPYRFRDIGETGACEIVARDVAVIMRLPKGEPLYTTPVPAQPHESVTYIDRNGAGRRSPGECETVCAVWVSDVEFVRAANDLGVCRD